ncbi:MAG: hypothetical protein K9L98_02320 [Candidatus Pacebacteria bacterium]|nr:hypothetical protein [Candidatus Paceibacterota bacterium]MCF7862821.1 hypothetical protein [Candidatus Paceibacterota bacterium]
MYKKIIHYFDKLEDRIRAKLSRKPLLYAFVGSIGVVLIWRGVWMLADEIYMPSWISLALGIGITMATGLFVSFFIGDKIIISGIKEEKRIDQKTAEEIMKEEEVLEEAEKDLKEIKEELVEIRKDTEKHHSKN